MKKLFAIMLTLAMAASFAACGSTPSSSQAASADPVDNTDSSVAQQQEEEPAVEPEEEEEEDTSWDYVADKGVLIVGLDDTFAPMGFRDEANELVGFDIDLANAVGELLGVEIQFQPIAWDAKELELDGFNIDCIWNGMSITPGRLESMTLTRGYLNNNIIIMTTEGVEINSKEDLLNYDITTQAKSAALEVMMEDEIYEQIADRVVEYESYDSCIMDMQSGRAQVMIIDAVAGEYKNTLLGGIFTVSEVDFGEDLYAVGFRKGDVALMEKVQDAIDELAANGVGEDISNEWFGRNLLLAA